MLTYRQGNLSRDSAVWQSGADGFSVGVGSIHLNEADGLVCPIGDLVSKNVVRELRDNIKEGLGRALDKSAMARPAPPRQVVDGSGFVDLQGFIVNREDAHQVGSQIGDKKEVASWIEDYMVSARLCLSTNSGPSRRQGKGDVLEHGDGVGVRDIMGGDGTSTTTGIELVSGSYIKGWGGG